MANGIKQTNNGFNSIYKGNFSIGINDVSYGDTTSTGFWNTIPATGSSIGNEIYAYIPKGSDGPSIYEMSTDTFEFLTGANQIKGQIEGPYIVNSTFTTTRDITIPSSSTASTYPLQFNVTGITSEVNFVTLTLGILSGSNVQNLGIVLVAPDNSTYALIKGSLTSPVATTGEISVNLSQYSGVYQFNFSQWDGYQAGNYYTNSFNRPTTLTFDSPCPVGPFNNNQNYNGINIFNNLSSGDTNGTWSLYIQDFGGDNSTLLYSNLSFTTNALRFPSEFFSWAESNDNIVLINRDYPSINVSGLQLLIDPWYSASANASALNGTNSLVSGQKISDLTNNNNDATTTGSGVSLGGTYYEYWGFNGNNPFTFDTVTNIPAGNSAYTMSVWFRTSYYTESLISFGSDTPSSYSANFLYINNSGYVTNDWCGTTITSTGSTLANNSWHNVVVTYDGTVATIYLDGSFNTDLTVGTSLNVSPTSNLKIGGGGNQNDFNGSMGPVMIYNRALTGEEISTNYTNISSSHGY